VKDRRSCLPVANQPGAGISSSSLPTLLN